MIELSMTPDLLSEYIFKTGATILALMFLGALVIASIFDL